MENKRIYYITGIAESFISLANPKTTAKACTFTSNMEDNWCTMVNNNIFSCLIEKNIYILTGPFQFSIFDESMSLCITEYLALCLFP